MGFIMRNQSFRIFKKSFAILGAAALLALGACGPRRAHTAVLTLNSADRTLSVIGHGEATGKPDLATANMGVEVSAPTLAEAMERAKTQMNKLFEAFKKLGIADNDIRTSNFSIHYERYASGPPMEPMPEAMAMPAPAPEKPAGKSAGKGGAAAAPVAPVAPPPPPPPRSEGAYHVSNTVEVRIRQLDGVSRVLDTAVENGANNVWGVNFSIDKPEALEGKARELAAADAKKRAEVLAKLNGLTLGPIVSVTETPGYGGPPGPLPYLAEMSTKGTPIAAGEVAVVSQVQVVYSLVPGLHEEPAEE